MGRRGVTEKARGESITLRFGRSIGRTTEEEEGAAMRDGWTLPEESPAGTVTGSAIGFSGTVLVEARKCR